MAKFLSPAWVESFNRALRDVAAPEPLNEPSNEAESPGGHRSYCVAQVVTDPPSDVAPSTGAGRSDASPTLNTYLVVDGDRIEFSLGPAEGGTLSPTEPADLAPSVTVVLSYGDAAAMSRGELDPIEALGSGRVRVRGDLSLLVASQAVFAAASNHLGDLQAHTTY